ncbi:MAG: EamA family transporter, partial [Bacteroidota bacterium]|nr:EamA family transporter [Bacteroidota bacterium]
VFIVLLAALAWTSYGIIQKIMIRKYPPQTLNLFLYFFPAVIFFPISTPSTLLTLTFTNWILLIFASLNTLIAYGALSAAFKYIEASKISMIVTMNPTITFLLMALMSFSGFHWIAPEHINATGGAGALLILAGALMVVKS